MAEYKLKLTEPRPFFAELPYYAWGQVNYDSDGDCKTPLDREWTQMVLTHRDTDEAVDITSSDSEWMVSGSDPVAARIAYFLQQRCAGEFVGSSPATDLQNWDHPRAMERAQRVATEFQNELLIPFATGHLFWGSWKWIGWFGTTFTWVGRWIMDSVARNDPRAVNLCIDWLRAGTVHETQSAALRYALNRLTGLSYLADCDWVEWYDSEGHSHYPEPDFEKWHQDLKAIHGE